MLLVRRDQSVSAIVRYNYIVLRRLENNREHLRNAWVVVNHEYLRHWESAPVLPNDFRTAIPESRPPVRLHLLNRVGARNQAWNNINPPH